MIVIADAIHLMEGYLYNIGGIRLKKQYASTFYQMEY